MAVLGRVTRADVIKLASKLRESNLQEIIKISDQNKAQEALLGALVGDNVGQTMHEKAFDKLRANQDYEIKFFKELEKKGKRQFFGGRFGALSRSLLPNRFYELDHKALQKQTSVDVSIEDCTSTTSQSSDSSVSSLNYSQSDRDIVNARHRAYEYLHQNISSQQDNAAAHIHLTISQACIKSLLRVGKREGKKKLQEGFAQIVLAQKMQAA